MMKTKEFSIGKENNFRTVGYQGIDGQLSVADVIEQLSRSEDTKERINIFADVKSIDLMALDENTIKVLLHLSESGYSLDIAQKLPKEGVIINDLDPEVIIILTTLLRKGHFDILSSLIFSKTENYSLSKVEANSYDVLQVCLGLGYENEFLKILDAIPDNFDLNTLSLSGGGIGVLLFSENKEFKDREVRKMMERGIDLSRLSEGGYEIISFLIDDGYVEEIFSLINQTNEIIDLTKISYGGALILTKLITHIDYDSLDDVFKDWESFDFDPDAPLNTPGFAKQSGEEISNGTDLDQADSKDVGGSNNEKSKQEIILNKVKANRNNFNLSKVSKDAHVLIKELLEYGLPHEVFLENTVNFDLTKINEGGAEVLSLLASYDNLFDKVASLLTANPSNRYFLMLITPKILGNLDSISDMSRINDSLLKLLVTIAYHDYEQKRNQYGQINLDFDNMSDDQVRIITILSSLDESLGLKLFLFSMQSAEEEETLPELDQSEVDHFSRHSFTFEMLNVSEDDDFSDAFPTLNEQLKRMPVDMTKFKKLRGGWFTTDLDKDGSTTKVYVKFDENKNVESILFRNEEIHLGTVETYKQAVRLLPGFVASSTYPEIHQENFSNNSLMKLYTNGSRSGLREVYAGVSLAAIQMSEIPKPIKAEILRQKAYILRVLKDNEIEHGHSHDANFNVRFYVEDKSGKRQVVFDLDKAISLLQENVDSTLTPVVTLRDWDQAMQFVP